MGMRTTLYGYIAEMDFWKDPIMTHVRILNTKKILLLPKGDAWPPLSKEMFAICENDENESGPDLLYSGRIIHLGANLKSVEHEWKEWKSKFENLLTNLFFLEARVHFKTEYSSLETSSWRVDLLKYAVLHDNSMPTRIGNTHWNYE